jgi:hypothetical protein
MSSSNNVNYPANPLATLALAPMTSPKGTGSGGSGSWFEAMSQAWGQTLDAQANRIQQQSDALSGGDDSPATITQLSTESLKMSFLSNSSHNAISSVGQALDTMARKQ